MKNIKKEAHDWLIERDITRWALFHDGGFRYETMKINASEYFNGVLKYVRGIPIQALIISIYYNIVSLFIHRIEDLSSQQSISDSEKFISLLHYYTE